MDARQICLLKDSVKLIDVYSKAEFTARELRSLLLPMIMARNPEANQFAERFALMDAE